MDAVGLPVGTRVKLRPRAGGDVFDLALAGKTAVVDVVETDMEGRVFVGVLVDDDPGRDLGERGHRFFFSPGGGRAAAGAGGGDRQRVPRRRRVRVRARAARVASRASTSSTSASAAWTSRTRSRTTTSWSSSTRRRAARPPGTLYVIEPDLDGLPLDVDAHAMHPVKVLALAKTLGGDAAADARARVRAGRRWRSSPTSASRCEAALDRGREAARGHVLRKETDMRNAIIVIGGVVAAVRRRAPRCCPRSGAT